MNAITACKSLACQTLLPLARAFPIFCITALILTLTGCGKQTINGVALPQFYGLYAIDDGKLVPIKQGEVPDFSPNVQFLLFDKSVEFGVNATYYNIGFDTEPHPADNGSFSWSKFIQQTEAYQRSTQAALTGIPENAVAIGTLKEPVPKQNDMLLFVPATKFQPGLYQFGNVARFWIDREKYQTAVESNARQAFQAGRWLDASRLASIALMVGPSNPRLADEFTQIKFGSLLKGANEAIKQGNFHTAENFAKRGNVLNPPQQFANQLNQLLNTEIPYAQAIEEASLAARNEDWDTLLQAGQRAISLKPDSTEAKILLAECPKIALPIPTDIRFGFKPLYVNYLQFSSDGNTLLVGATTHAEKEHPDSQCDSIIGWSMKTMKQITIPNGELAFNNLNYKIAPDGKMLAVIGKNHFDISSGNFGSVSFYDLFATNKMNPTLDIDWVRHWGFSGDGAVLWTEVHELSAAQVEHLGLAWPAERLGLLDMRYTGEELKPCVILWSVASLKPIGMIGLTSSFRNAVVYNVCLTRDDTTAILYEKVAEGHNPYRSYLSAWNIANSECLAKTETTNSNFSLWGVDSGDDAAIVWTDGRFWQWNWQQNEFKSPMNLPTEGHHTITFSQNDKYIADWSANDSKIRIWDFDTGKVLCTFAEARGVNLKFIALSPDGSYLATVLDRPANFLALWKIPADVKSLISHRVKVHVVTMASRTNQTSTVGSEKASANNYYKKANNLFQNEGRADDALQELSKAEAISSDSQNIANLRDKIDKERPFIEMIDAAIQNVLTSPRFSDTGGSTVVVEINQIDNFVGDWFDTDVLSKRACYELNTKGDGIVAVLAQGGVVGPISKVPQHTPDFLLSGRVVERGIGIYATYSIELQLKRANGGFAVWRWQRTIKPTMNTQQQRRQAAVLEQRSEQSALGTEVGLASGDATTASRQHDETQQRDKSWHTFTQEFPGSSYSRIVVYHYQKSLSEAEEGTIKALKSWLCVWKLQKETKPNERTILMVLAPGGITAKMGYKRSSALMLSQLEYGLVEMRIKTWVYQPGSMSPHAMSRALKSQSNNLLDGLKLHLGDPQIVSDTEH